MASNVNIKGSSSLYCKACGAANPAQATHCTVCGGPLANVLGASLATTNPLTGLLLPNIVIQQRYRIVEVLHTGEVSTVYKAEDSRLGNRTIALKEIGKNNLLTQDALEAIENSKRETLLLAGLNHPNLPHIYDYFVENHRWYFVMDFLAGDTLEAYLKKRKYQPLPAEDVIDAGIQLATVLDYLHAHQLLLDFNRLTLRTIWRTPDGTLYPLDIGTPSSASATPVSSSIDKLGKILRQLQTGKTPARPRSFGAVFALPRLYRRFSYATHPQSAPLTLLIRQMIDKNVHKRPYTIGLIKQELQHLAMQHVPPPSLKKRLLSRRALFRLGKIAGLAGVAAVASSLTWAMEYQTNKQHPITSYSPHIGGTIYTYDAADSVLAVAWSPNGARIAIGGGNGQITTWNANTGHHALSYLSRNQWQNIEAVIWLPDGNSIAAGGDDSIVWVWNAANGNMQTTYNGHSNWVITIACSPDGKYIASGSLDKTVHVWEAATSRQVVIYRGHSSGIGSVTWSPDGRYIASASFDRTVQVWEAATGRLVFTYRGHTQGVYTVAWSPDGQYIASGGKDLTVQVWPVSLFENNEQLSKRSIITYRGHTKAVQAVAWSPNSRSIASTGENVQIWNGLTGKHIYTYTKHAISLSLEVQAVAWSPNGKYIVSGGMEGTAQVWNAP